MPIPVNSYDLINEIDIDSHRTQIEYRYWEDTFVNNKYLLDRILTIKSSLGIRVTRTDLVNFYSRSDIPAETKFIAAMIWGHEAPAGSRRDSRGPWKLSKMFSDCTVSERVIRDISLSSFEDIEESYTNLNKTLDRCGPNFFTKHFYFLGKTISDKKYPVIFDDRVATGLLKLSLPQKTPRLGMVNISATRKPEAYISYLKFVYDQAEKIKCSPDQIEYYLFNL